MLIATGTPNRISPIRSANITRVVAIVHSSNAAQYSINRVVKKRSSLLDVKGTGSFIFHDDRR
jgi:hypothetical protein